MNEEQQEFERNRKWLQMADSNEERERERKKEHREEEIEEEVER